MSDNKKKLIELPFADEGEPAALLSKKIGGIVGGLDEAGRGPLAGNVVSGCVVLANPIGFDGLSDSKKLNDKKRDALFDLIWEHALAVGVGIARPDEIDDINILQASLLSMSRAFDACQKMLREKHALSMAGAVVDGNQLAPLPEGIVQQTIVKGDSKSPPIMAASIIAKVTRDREMIVAEKEYPGYGFGKHKGYPTKAHREALQKLGATPLHRRSFSPVRMAIESRETSA